MRSAPEWPLAVLYPRLQAPAGAIFRDLIEGIESTAGDRVRAYPLDADYAAVELAATLKRNGTRAVIALGRQGLQAAAAAAAPQALIIGGVSSIPNSTRALGICLTPDPALLFAQLRLLMPAARRILTVYDPHHNNWLMGIGREAARAMEMELVTHEAGDLASAARRFRAACAGADSKRDAIWLPTDPTTVDEATIVPQVLRDAWTRRLPVFSSSFLHVNKGALFSLYPNNVELGCALADIAVDLLDGGRPASGMTPLRQIHAALNVRTATHVGAALDMQAAFKYVYPSAPP